jgi:hypothetical protein
MKMGRERDVLRWDIHASLLRGRIAGLEASLASAGAREPAHADERIARLERELDAMRRQLAALGPSPRAKMG